MRVSETTQRRDIENFQQKQNCSFAENIKVDVDRSQDAIKLNVLASSKNLYISCGKDSKSLYAKVNCAATEDVTTQKKAVLVANLAEYGTELGK